MVYHYDLLLQAPLQLQVINEITLFDQCKQRVGEDVGHTGQAAEPSRES